MTRPSRGHAPVALIVDDDLMMRMLIRQTLERAGFVCHEAEHGAAALERFPALERGVRRLIRADDSLPVFRRQEPALMGDFVEMGSGGALVSNAKAVRLLGYHPVVSNDAALALTLEWIKHARLV